MRQRGYRGPGPRQAPRTAPASRGPRVQVCGWCGGAGTHYLTCKTLRLPAGYQVGGSARRRAPGGPDHPDWPARPRGDF